MSDAKPEAPGQGESAAAATPAPAAAAAAPTQVSGQLPKSDLARVLDVRVEASVELGRRRMSIAEVLGLAPNTVMEFLKKADEPLDIRVNGRLIARGEAVVMGDRYGVRVTEIVAPTSHKGRIEVGDLAK